jgi:hypothetical protein
MKGTSFDGVREEDSRLERGSGCSGGGAEERVNKGSMWGISDVSEIFVLTLFRCVCHGKRKEKPRIPGRPRCGQGPPMAEARTLPLPPFFHNRGHLTPHRHPTVLHG